MEDVSLDRFDTMNASDEFYKVFDRDYQYDPEQELPAARSGAACVAGQAATCAVVCDSGCGPAGVGQESGAGGARLSLVHGGAPWTARVLLAWSCVTDVDGKNTTTTPLTRSCTSTTTQTEAIVAAPPKIWDSTRYYEVLSVTVCGCRTTVHMFSGFARHRCLVQGGEINPDSTLRSDTHRGPSGFVAKALSAPKTHFNGDLTFF